jgi:hypothetical protein
MKLRWISRLHVALIAVFALTSCGGSLNTPGTEAWHQSSV